MVLDALWRSENWRSKHKPLQKLPKWALQIRLADFQGWTKRQQFILVITENRAQKIEPPVYAVYSIYFCLCGDATLKISGIRESDLCIRELSSPGSYTSLNKSITPILMFIRTQCFSSSSFSPPHLLPVPPSPSLVTSFITSRPTVVSIKFQWLWILLSQWWPPYQSLERIPKPEMGIPFEPLKQRFLSHPMKSIGFQRVQRILSSRTTRYGIKIEIETVPLWEQYIL